MRTGFLAILALVFALTGYVCWHLWRIAPSGWKLAVTGLFLLWMATMFAGFAFTERVPVKLATVLYEVGNTWMIAFLYLLLVFLVADIASFCHLLPKTLLKDSVAHFKGVDVIGRKDRTTPGRAALRDLADGLEGFTVLLDHQPNHLEEAEAAGIDFQFSGHTHRGQVWPVSWFTDAIFEKSWGHYRKGDTRYYISSGLGLWGAKIRVGTRSEYLVLKLKETND